MSIRSALSKLIRPTGAPTLVRAQEARAQARYADAATLLRTMAESNDPQAQWRLAQMYERGEGVLQNFREAERWLRMAAQRGCYAALRLADLAQHGPRNQTMKRQNDCQVSAP